MAKFDMDLDDDGTLDGIPQVGISPWVYIIGSVILAGIGGFCIIRWRRNYIEIVEKKKETSPSPP